MTHWHCSITPMSNIEEDLDEYPDDIDAVDGDIALEDCCVAIEDYAAKAFDELDLYEGQVVCVIDGTEEGTCPPKLLKT